MAKVYLAHDEVLGRDVALKVLGEQYGGDEEFVERFRREARSAAALSHPNIVSVYDRGETEDGAPYISMEYVPRGTLEERIRKEGRLDWPAALAVAAQIAEALEAAHERGVIHRDIKPQNILVTKSGDVKVADFGIARAASATPMTGSLVLGTADYMSPEQASGQAVGPRSDLYSLGIVLYEMLTGRAPRSSGAATGSKTEGPRPGSVVPEVPATLDALVARLLAEDPAGRPRSATALLDELRRVEDGNPEETQAPKTAKTAVAPQTSPAERERGVDGPPRRPRSRRRVNPRSVIPWVLVVLFVVIVGLVLRYVLDLLGNPPIP